MAFKKCIPMSDAPVGGKPLSFSIKIHHNNQLSDHHKKNMIEHDIGVDLREVYFLIMHFLSSGPCHRTCGQLWNELLEHRLIPRRYHAWYSRSRAPSGDENDDGISLPLSYTQLVDRHPRIEKDHLIRLLKQLLLNTATFSSGSLDGCAPNAADVPTLLGNGPFSLLSGDKSEKFSKPPIHLRWPHLKAGQVHGIMLREIGGGFARHHCAPSVRAACYAIAKPSTMIQKMQNNKKLRGHRNAVYCAIFDRSGRYVITGSDDRLVKIWSLETAFCLASCRGHEGDITDLAVNYNNTVVASASNDFMIRVWRLPDGLPISVLRGHTGSVTAIVFSPRPGSAYQLLSSSDDGTCRMWDARTSQFCPRIYIPRNSDFVPGRNNGSCFPNVPQGRQILSCAFNSDGSVFATGSSDNLARVWGAFKHSMGDSDKPNHELDILSGHENDVNYVQFSGCSMMPKFSDGSKDGSIPKFRNSWLSNDSIVTCSRDGSAIIWVPKLQRTHGRKAIRWTQSYHLKVPPPPFQPQPHRGGPRQRLVPTPRGVNMIMWSLDNRFVLAAIMDCRICVWNAADGNLVHSLTGHTGSTYVLDVHPFYPQIAMSAGYDGKTIVWDIWEGVPIRIHETAPFKLVDGKFSPDGTSIILSDDVGQLYIVSTGQGESQKDAKYDQFFLGDYRPLMRDANGNVLDQETQLVPYKRNMQDFLCDSAMHPYMEPYQSMYQRRRLGTLGMEWKPPSVVLTTGLDFSIGMDFQSPLPRIDLDELVEPLPEYADALDWEQANEIPSDDTDSEYNIGEEYSTECEPESFGYSPATDMESGSADSEAENDRFLLSKRTKLSEVATEASLRRFVKRNKGERRHVSSRNGQKKSIVKVPRRRSSHSKALRPRRAAAQNALSLFSRITGVRVEREESEPEESLSEMDSSAQESEFESDGSESSNDEEVGGSGGKDLLTREITNLETDESNEPHMNPPNQRFVFRFRSGDTNRHKVPTEDENELPNVVMDKINHASSAMGNSNSSSVLAVNMDAERECHMENCHLSLPEEVKASDIRWGGVKPRSSKRQKLEYTFDAYLTETEKEESEPEEDNYNSRPLSVKIRIKPQKVSCLDQQNKDTYHSSDKTTEPDIGSEIFPSVKQDSRFKSYSVVYKRSKPSKSVADKRFHNPNLRSEPEMHENATEEAPLASTSFAASSVSVSGKRGLKHTHVNKRGFDRIELPFELVESSSRARVGLRSTMARNRRTNLTHYSSLPERSCSHEAFKMGSWLMLSRHEEGCRYIPQLGDEVAYLRQGHQEYIEHCLSEGYRHPKEAVPWKTFKGNIRATEICKVENLEYSTLPGSGESCCKMALEFIDSSSEVFGKSFNLTLPEVTGFPDFLIERTWFDTAMEKNWMPTDDCRVWWRVEGEDDGSWWEGQVIRVAPKTTEFPDSPWDMCTVQYYSDCSEHQHSPWELFDAETRWCQPCICGTIRDKLLSAFAKLELAGQKVQDRYGIQKLKQAFQKPSFMNRFPVPMSLEVIQERLQNNYYRTLDAVKHDVEVMISNAESYFAKNAEYSKMKRLADWLRRTLSNL